LKKEKSIGVFNEERKNHGNPFNPVRIMGQDNNRGIAGQVSQ
jgi:hypothetical protein